MTLVNPVATYAGFVDAMMARKVVRTETGVRVPISKNERNRNWSLPSYDFGSLLDQTREDCIAYRIVTGPAQVPLEIQVEVIGDVVAPLETRVEAIGDVVVLLDLEPGRFLIVRRFGIRDHPDDNGARHWVYRLAPDGIWESRAPDFYDLEVLFFLAMFLLHNPGVIEVERTARTRLARPAKDGRRSLPGPSIVRLTRTRCVGVDWIDERKCGSPKGPHYRRGHYRTYRSGRRVWVKSCAIHDYDGPPVARLVVSGQARTRRPGGVSQRRRDDLDNVAALASASEGSPAGTAPHQVRTQTPKSRGEPLQTPGAGSVHFDAAGPRPRLKLGQ